MEKYTDNSRWTLQGFLAHASGSCIVTETIFSNSFLRWLSTNISSFYRKDFLKKYNDSKNLIFIKKYVHYASYHMGNKTQSENIYIEVIRILNVKNNITDL